MNRLILVLLSFIFSIAAFAADESVSFSGTITNDCTIQVVDANGGLVLINLSTLSSDPADGASVSLSCPLASTISISAPNVVEGTLTDSGSSSCSFFGTDPNVTGTTGGSTSVAAGFSDTINIEMLWRNTVIIPDDTYRIDCTITATPS